MQNILQCCVFLFLVMNIFANEILDNQFTDGNENNIYYNSDKVKISANTLKKVMWKKCSNNSYITCVKLAAVHVIEKLESSENSIVLPGVSLSKTNDISNESLSKHIVSNKDFNEALDKYLLQKIKKYLSSLILSIRLLDKNMMEEMRKFGKKYEDTDFSKTIETGRGKKKYIHSLLMAGWMSGATLLALTMKTIALLSGKALLAALLSLILSVISAFSHKGHAETKSTTYEIITKPIVAHTHTADVHEAHASDFHPNYTYKRSVSPEIILKTTDVPYNIDHIIRKINDQRPYYTPIEYSKS